MTEWRTWGVFDRSILMVLGIELTLKLPDPLLQASSMLTRLGSLDAICVDLGAVATGRSASITSDLVTLSKHSLYVD